MLFAFWFFTIAAFWGHLSALDFCCYFLLFAFPSTVLCEVYFMEKKQFDGSDLEGKGLAEVVHVNCRVHKRTHILLT